MSVDPRSAKAIATLRPKARPWFEELVTKANAALAEHGLRVVVTSGNRTWQEQDALFAQGRTKPGKRVTNARGGQSNHNYQIAVDITIFSGSTPVWESPHYKAVGRIGKAIGLEWGGDWTSIRDEPHFQIKTGKSVSQLRALVNSQGWAAIDALIPSHSAEANLVTPPAVEPAPEDVAIYFDDLDDGKPAQKFDIPAWLIDGSTWVDPESFCDYFGGEWVTVDRGGAGMVPELQINGQSKMIQRTRVAGGWVVKFSDLNTLLGLPFSFDGKRAPKRLTIHRDDDKGTTP